MKEPTKLRDMQIIIQCSERECGSIIADMTERKGVTLAGVSVISTLPVHKNGRPEGITTYEVIQKICAAMPNGFSPQDVKAAFERVGFKPAGVYPALSVLEKSGELTKVKKGKAKGHGVIYLPKRPQLSAPKHHQQKGA